METSPGSNSNETYREISQLGLLQGIEESLVAQIQEMKAVEKAKDVPNITGLSDLERQLKETRAEILKLSQESADSVPVAQTETEEDVALKERIENDEEIIERAKKRLIEIEIELAEADGKEGAKAMEKLIDAKEDRIGRISQELDTLGKRRFIHRAQLQREDAKLHRELRELKSKLDKFYSETGTSPFDL